MPKFEVIRYDETTQSATSTIYYDMKTKVKDEDKDNEENEEN